tara:strand:- start:392 stop:547 length:156 start_codon:yes stop_codon:yes gene_type:complete
MTAAGSPGRISRRRNISRDATSRVTIRAVNLRNMKNVIYLGVQIQEPFVSK